MNVETATTERPTFGEPGPSIREFLRSDAFIRVLLGGRGSGKTSGLVEDITGHIFQNAGAKAIVARETEVSQQDSSIESFWRYFEGLGPLYNPGGPGLFKSWNNGRTFRIPSRLAIERMQLECAHMTTRAEIAHWIQTKGDKLCGYIEFRGLPDADKGKFRGMECSYFAIVEADQVSEKQFQLCLACLRWKGMDPDTCDERGFIKDRCVVLDTNPPGPTHWIAEFEEREAEKPEEERAARFWHISTYENEHNLPPHYIRDTILLPYARNPAMLARMLDGKYADAFGGKPVYYNFQPTIHGGEDLEWADGSYLIEGLDYGTSNATVWLAYWLDGQDEYLWALKEQILDGSDTERQALGILSIRESEFPWWNDRSICAGLLTFGDPAGGNKNYTTKDTESAVAIMKTHNICPGTLLWNRGIAVGITILNRFMAKRDRHGRPCFKIDRKHCPKLFSALSGGYRYPEPGEPGFNGDKSEPLKGLAAQDYDYSHVADSFRYPAMNVLKLMRADYEKVKKPLFRVEQESRRKPANRLRRL